MSGRRIEIFDAIVKAVSTDPCGHLPNCGYTDEVQECGCAEMGGRILTLATDIAAREAAAAEQARAEVVAADIEAVLAAHISWTDAAAGCMGCGWEPDSADYAGVKHREHVAAMIRAALATEPT